MFHVSAINLEEEVIKLLAVYDYVVIPPVSCEQDFSLYYTVCSCCCCCWYAGNVDDAAAVFRRCWCVVVVCISVEICLRHDVTLASVCRPGHVHCTFIATRQPLETHLRYDLFVYLFISLGLTLRISRTVYRYFWAYPFFLFFSFCLFHFFSFWFHAVD